MSHHVMSLHIVWHLEVVVTLQTGVCYYFDTNKSKPWSMHEPQPLELIVNLINIKYLTEYEHTSGLIC